MELNRKLVFFLFRLYLKRRRVAFAFAFAFAFLQGKAWMRCICTLQDCGMKFEIVNNNHKPWYTYVHVRY